MTTSSMVPHQLGEQHRADFAKQQAWLYAQWKKSLEGLGVQWPTSKVAVAQLVGLSFFIGEPVAKDSLGEFVADLAGGSKDTQARHLRRQGWQIAGGGRGEAHTNHLASGARMPRNSYALLSATQPSLTYVRASRLKREGRLGARDWSEVCAVYGGKCAHCGSLTPNPDKGHMDPNPGLTLNNLIPLCVSCNNWAQDDVMFGADGKVTAVRSKRFLEQSDHAAQVRMYSWLKKSLGK